jgi:hypothetical protein
MALILMYGVGLSRSAGVGDGVDCLQGEDFDHGSARWAEMTEVEIFQARRMWQFQQRRAWKT